MNNPNCPGCGKPLQKVKQSANGMLNAEQFDAARAGDWFCSTCPGNNQARTGYRYFWDKDLAAWGRDMIAPQAASQQAENAGFTITEAELGAIDNAISHLVGSHELPVTTGILDQLSKRAWAGLAPQAATTASADDSEFLAALQGAAKEATDEWIAGFVRQHFGIYAATTASASVLSDEQIVAALHAHGIDTYPSKFGFDALQVSATSVQNLRAVIEHLAALARAPLPGVVNQEGGANA